MALTGGLLTFLGVDALFEAFQLQGTVPGAFGGPGLVLLGVAISYLTMTFISTRFSAEEGSGGALGGVALATLVAIGIGLHNFGEGLAIGSSFAFGQLALGSFLIIGFMIHNVTEGLGIAAPAADSGAALSPVRLGVLAAIAGGPAILGTWTGGFIANDVLAVLFFGAAAGAAFEVVVEVARYVSRRDPSGLRSRLGDRRLPGRDHGHVRDRLARRLIEVGRGGARALARPRRSLDRPFACRRARGRDQPRHSRSHGGGTGVCLRPQRQRGAARRPDPQRR